MGCIRGSRFQRECFLARSELHRRCNMGKRAFLAGMALGVLMALTGLLAASPEITAQTVSGGGALCADDDFEENDTRAMASPLPGDTVGSGLTDLRAAGFGWGPPLRSCPGDEDWFSVPLVRGQQVQINVVFQHAEGDIDIYLIGPGDLGVASSLSVTDDEEITYTTDFTSEYALLVELLSDTGSVAGNDYALAAFRSLSAGEWGDANCDGIINAIDAALDLQLVAGLVNSLLCEANGDASANGIITAIDALLILQLDAGLIAL
jgi:hypothetical protein